DLAITGMTCASCSARIERKLNKMEGVEASVNLATEKAHVEYSAPLTVEDLMTVVRNAGYGAEPLGGAARSGAAQPGVTGSGAAGPGAAGSSGGTAARAGNGTGAA